MEPRNVIMWALLPVIVLLVMSTGVQAQELREVSASEILEQIQAGEDIHLENVRITGEFNLSRIDLVTVPVARTEWGIEIWGLEEESKIVESEITIINSVFEKNVDFSNTHFIKALNFYNSSFLGISDFRGAVFVGDADFESADFSGGTGFLIIDFSGDIDPEYVDFSGGACFYAANFFGDADFGSADFGGDVHFGYANFFGDADFGWADFSDGAKFWYANFDDDADFIFVDFRDYADFCGADFGGDAKFWDTNFGGDTRFWYANFSADAKFWDTNFGGDANFLDANFGGDANFLDANFGGDANFLDAVFGGDAEFGGVDFGGDAIFNSTEFNKVSFSNTTFTNVYLHGADFKRMSVDWTSLKDVLVFDGPTYIKLIKNFRDMEQFGDADDAYYQYRRLSQADKKWSFSKLGDIFMWLSCGYGVKPQYTIGLGVAIILLLSLIYWRGNGIRRLKEIEGDNNRVSFWDALYFSMVTFTTVGFGDWYPADRYRVLVMIEGLVGWLILALFLVTLANVMIRP